MKTKKFAHALITNFNVFEENTSKQLAEDPQWLKNRFDEFDKLCFPSIQAQTVKNFTWYICFSESTPDWAREKINVYKSLLPNLEPVFSAENWQDRLKGSLSKDTISVITTNLDACDGLSTDALETVQNHFTGQYFCFLNFDKGYQLEETQCFEQTLENNRSYSLFQRKDNPNFARLASLDPEKISKHGPVINLNDKPYWVTPLKGGLGEGLSPGIPSSPGNLVKRFSFSSELNQKIQYIAETLEHVHFLEENSDLEGALQVLLQLNSLSFADPFLLNETARLQLANGDIARSFFANTYAVAVKTNNKPALKSLVSHLENDQFKDEVIKILYSFLAQPNYSNLPGIELIRSLCTMASVNQNFDLDYCESLSILFDSVYTVAVDPSNKRSLKTLASSLEESSLKEEGLRVIELLTSNPNCSELKGIELLRSISSIATSNSHLVKDFCDSFCVENPLAVASVG